MTSVLPGTKYLCGLVATLLVAGTGALAADTTLDPLQTDTMLLVSLDDGSLIQQTIHVDADTCFKANRDSNVTCFRRGQPILSEAGATIGFEMEQSQIQLIAKE